MTSLFTRRAVALLAASSIVATAGVGVAQSQGSAQETFIGLTEPSKSIKIGFDIRGVVAKVDVKRNDRVKEGQTLISLDDSEEQALLEFYNLRADTSLQVAEAEETYKVKVIDWERKKNMFEQSKVATDFEVRTAEAEMNISKIRVEQAKHDAAVAQAQANAQAAKVGRMRKVSPIEGEIREVIVKPGEQVDESKPVMEIVDLDPLYVQVSLASRSVVRPLKVGQTVQVKYADESQWRDATIESIDPLADGRSGTHPFRLSLPNPDGRAGGDRVEVRLPGSVANTN